MIQALTEGYYTAVADNPQDSRHVIALRFIDTLERLLAQQSPNEHADIAVTWQIVHDDEP